MRYLIQRDQIRLVNRCESIHDAIEAGFNKIIFIIRHDIEEDFKKVIGHRIEAYCASLGHRH